MQKWTFLYALLVTLTLSAQEQMPRYHSPLPIPLILAGNFGELRPNHFHMGVDFKTQGREGFALSSIEEGFISRVKVSTFGYGKAVYIDHPNGVTSVYAHCSKFLGKLDSLVKLEQYRTENFEVELFFGPTDLPVKRGEVFALSGNTGGSTAPHLHFEVRDTKSEKAKNPLVHAFRLADNRAPELRKLKAFAVNEQGYLVPGKSIERAVSAVKNTYSIVGDTLRVPASFCSNFGGVGLAVDMIDRLDGAANPCGVYGTYLIVDGDTIFGHKMDAISFDHSRYINSHRDLSAMSNQFHKSFRNSSNPLEIYIKNGLGVIHLEPGVPKKVQFVAYDLMGNTSQLNFVLVANLGEISEDFNPSTEKYWYPENEYIRKTKTWELVADSFSIYEPYALSNSSTAHVCDVHTAMQKRVTIRMKLENPTLPIEKYFISVSTKAGGRKPLPTIYKDGWLEAKSNNAGTFTIQSDEIPPVIKPITASTIIKTNVVKFSVKDALSGLADCDLYINGAWHLLEYEYKGNYVFFEMPAIENGRHTFKIVAKDACGNSSVWEQEMTVALPVSVPK